MRYLLCKRNCTRLILAALTAGGLTLPAAAAQSSARKSSSKSSSTTHNSGSTNKPKTSSSKSPKTSSKKRSKRVKGQAAPSPDRINEIQEALAKKGVYEGSPSGKWDDSTSEAMKKFQASNGLNPSGKLDARTLQKLGLGSETAGVAAPTPPPNSTANRLLSPSAQRDSLKNEPE
jgi:peptidoglycan hydrolase-like protein with peptidoglycan-binding domain